MGLQKEQIAEKLREHIRNLYGFLETDEIIAFYKIINHILNTCAYEEKEYAHINRGKSHNFEKLLDKEGTENQAKFPDEETEIIDNEDILTLTVIHNHPNSTAPSHDDFTFLIQHGSVQNMIVFGVIGNLYFIQKSDPELHFNYSSKDRKDKLKQKLEKLFNIMGNKYIKNKYPNLAPEVRKEIICRDPREINKILAKITYEYFKRICKDYKFHFYPQMELIKNGN
jgi:hypothetical protein